MKKLLLFIAIVTCVGANGQTNVYQPWPADSAVWFLEYYPYISSPNPPVYYTWTVWFGDTVINTKTYKRVFSSNGYSSTSYTYTGGVRQDIPNEKLYKIGTSGSEYEVFNNQHLAIGDTFPTFIGNVILTNIDSIIIGTKYHKRYNDTSLAGFGINHRYIVGFGPALDESDSYYYHLVCYSVDNNVLYGGGGAGCPLPANTIGIKLFDKSNEINIYPNPTSDQFYIKTNLTAKLNVDLYDVNGRHVFSKSISDKSAIDVKTLNEGIYSLIIKTADRIINKKLVILR